MSKTASRWVRLKGKLTRPLAHAAGDRRSEAKAEVEAATGRKPEEPVVDAVERQVRREHHDIGGVRQPPPESP